jgi:hypothetical protein
MSKLHIDYICEDCGQKAPKDYSRMICPYCDGYIVGRGFPSVNGTRDSFGVGKEFYDVKTGRYIDNFKSWEKAGFREPGQSGARNSGFIKEKVKEIKQRKNYATKSKAVSYAETI